MELLFLYRQTPSGLLPGFCEFAAVLIVHGGLSVYLNQWLQIRWRRWMTTHYLDEWLADRAYYRISLTTDRAAIGTDNPDQRIAEDLRDFTDSTLSLGLDLLSNIVSLFSFVAILWGLSGAMRCSASRIPGYMVWVALVYAVDRHLAHPLGRPAAGGAEFPPAAGGGGFPLRLVRVRENMEGIALYRGEDEEKAAAAAPVRRGGRQLVRDHAADEAAEHAGRTATARSAVIFPIVVAAPRYFAGAMQLGGLMQTAGAFGQVQGSLSWFVDRLCLAGQLARDRRAPGHVPSTPSSRRAPAAATDFRARRLAGRHGAVCTT